MPITRFRIRRRRYGRLGSFVLVALALATLIAACGGSTKVVSGPSTTATTVKGQTPFVSCMEKQGIPASAATSLGNRAGRGGGPGGGGGTPPSLPAGVTQTQLRTALQACRSLQPAGSGFGRGGGANSPAVAAYRNCLQLHGVTLPAPGSQTSTTTAPGSSTSAGSGGSGNGGRGLGGLDTSNPTVQAAMTACASLRPAPGGTTTSSTTATSS